MVNYIVKFEDNVYEVVEVNTNRIIASFVSKADAIKFHQRILSRGALQAINKLPQHQNDNNGNQTGNKPPQSIVIHQYATPATIKKVEDESEVKKVSKDSLKSKEASEATQFLNKLPERVAIDSRTYDEGYMDGYNDAYDDRYGNELIEKIEKIVNDKVTEDSDAPIERGIKPMVDEKFDESTVDTLDREFDSIMKRDYEQNDFDFGITEQKDTVLFENNHDKINISTNFLEALKQKKKKKIDNEVAVDFEMENKENEKSTSSEIDFEKTPVVKKETKTYQPIYNPRPRPFIPKPTDYIVIQPKIPAFEQTKEVLDNAKEEKLQPIQMHNRKVYKEPYNPIEITSDNTEVVKKMSKKDANYKTKKAAYENAKTATFTKTQNETTNLNRTATFEQDEDTNTYVNNLLSDDIMLEKGSDLIDYGPIDENDEMFSTPHHDAELDEDDKYYKSAKNKRTLRKLKKTNEKNRKLQLKKLKQ